MGLEAEILFLVSAAALVALVPGYLVWLRSARPKPAAPVTNGPAAPVADPLPTAASVSVIVPVRDEATWIEHKLHNLAALIGPPGGLDFWIVDGGSEDGTAEMVERFSASDARFRLIRNVAGGKIAQLDVALGCCDAVWILVTDADAWLPRHAVLGMLAEAAGDADIAAVGVPIEPRGAHMLDRLHWRELNAARAAEARMGSAALVTGPCYLFRRELLPRGFAPGVVADDVHVAMTAAACGKRVGFAATVTVVELRSPASLAEMFHHKVRKADAYLREIVRFLPLITEFPAPARSVFLWRAAQMLLFPIAALGLAAGTAEGLLAAGPATAAVLTAGAAGVLGADALLARQQQRDPRLAPAAALAVLLAAVLLTVLVTAPFARRTARYPKVSGIGGWREEEAET